MSEVKKAVTVVDKATKALAKAAFDISKAVDSVAVMREQATDLAFDIEQKSSHMAIINDEIKKREREAAADLAIRVKENEAKVLAELLKAAELTAKPTKELQELLARTAEAERNVESAVEVAISKTAKELQAKNAAHLAQVTAEHKVATAELEAEKTAMLQQVKYLEQSNAQLQKMLDEERVARVEVARNSSQPVVNVNGGK